MSLQEPSVPASPTDNTGDLEWMLVMITRRCWTALSVMVLALVSWVLLGRHRGTLLTIPGHTLAGLALLSGVIWLHAQRQVLLLHHWLGRPLPWSHRPTRLRSPHLQGG